MITPKLQPMDWSEKIIFSDEEQSQATNGSGAGETHETSERASPTDAETQQHHEGGNGAANAAARGTDFFEIANFYTIRVIFISSCTS